MKTLTHNYLLPFVEGTSFLLRRSAFYLFIFFVGHFSVSGLLEIMAEKHVVPLSDFGPTEAEILEAKSNSYNIFHEQKSEDFVFKSYDFTDIAVFNRRLNLSFISAVDKEHLASALVMSLPRSLRTSATLYIEDILEFSQHYQLDPLWVTSIVWTESHFRPRVKSRVSARGLMQIMPNTGKFLSELLKRPSDKDLVLQLLNDPRTNIELGTFYLKRLLKRFKSHRYATVAYNMGPRFVSTRIRDRLPIGVKNRYWDKVRHHYGKLLVGIKKLENESRTLGEDSLLLRKPASYDARYFLGQDNFFNLYPNFALR